MTNPSLVLAVPDLPRARAIIRGAVRPRGIDLTVVHQFKSVGERHDGMLHGKYDAAEMSTATFIQTRALGVGEPQLALPVFFIRGLRQRNILVNRNSGLRHPSDLRGKRVAVTRFSATTIVWVCGMLEEEYGVPLESASWITAEEEHIKVDNPRLSFEHLNAKRRVLFDMLSKGDIDAAIFPGNDDYASIYGGGHLEEWIAPYPDLTMLVDDPEFILEYYRRERIYPVIHTITVRESLVRERPEIASELLGAFRQAKELAFNYVDEEGKRRMDAERNALGWDPYAYKLDDADRRTLERLVAYMVDQRLIDKRLRVEDLFAPGCT